MVVVDRPVPTSDRLGFGVDPPDRIAALTRPHVQGNVLSPYSSADKGAFRPA
jgi:hypothetical protein